jgi:hypothetical protein
MAAPSAERQVRVRVTCLRPPDPGAHKAEFGLQDRDQQVHPGQVLADGSIRFECWLLVRPQAKTGQPNFLGEYAHGSPAQRFLYLSWRPRKPRGAPWSRRMKVHLSSITWEQIEEAGQTHSLLEAAVPGTAADGGLKSGSVELLGGGWSVR